MKISRHLKFLMTVLLLLCTTATSAIDQDGIFYRLDASSKTATVQRSISYSGAIVIPESITYNGEAYAVTCIGYCAFYECSNLTSVTIGNRVTSIEESAFYNCTALTSITIPDNVTSIGNYAFNSAALKSIEIGTGLTTVGTGVFDGCPLESIVVDSNNPVYDSRNSCNAMIETATNTIIVGCKNTTFENSITKIGEGAYAYRPNITDVAIPDNITGIDRNAFWGCSNLTSIKLPSLLTVIEEGALSRTGVTEITIPEGVTSIGKYAFDNNPALSKVELPQTLTEIGEYAFENCSSITRIVIPQKVTSIGNQAFNGCTSLKELRIEDCGNALTLGYNAYNETEDGKGLFADCPLETLYLGRDLEYPIEKSYGYSPFMNKATLTDVTIGEYVTHLNSSLLCYSTNLTHLEIPGNVKTIGNHAVGACNKLTELTIGEGVETIDVDAFNSCTSLASIEIPGSITSIGDKAFYACLALGEIISWATTPPVLGGNTFGIINNYATLYVPHCSKSSYAASGWGVIRNIVEPTFNLTYKVNGTVYQTVSTVFGECITAIDAPGIPCYTFIGWEGLPEYMPLNDVEVNAIYEQTAVEISTGEYGTITYSSQYALDFSEVEGLKAYTATGYNTATGEIIMTRANSTDAVVGVYLIGDPNTTYYIPMIDYSDNHSLNLLVATPENTIVNSTSDDGLYVNYKYEMKAGDSAPKFHKFNDGDISKAGNAYLQVPFAWFKGNAQKVLGIILEEAGTTGIDKVDGCRESDTIYDLQGRIVESPTRGIYIVNGKKAYIK